MEYLLKNGFQVDDRDAKGWTPLHIALMYDQHEVATQLIDCGANPHIVASIEINELSIAERFSIKTFFKTHNLGCPTSPIFDWNCAFLAAHCHQPSILSTLIRDHFQDQLNSQTPSGSTLLHESVCLPKHYNFEDSMTVQNHQETISVILGYGADPNMVDSSGKTPLHLFFDDVNLTSNGIKCLPRMVLDTVHQFLQYKQDLSIADSSRRTVCHQAAVFGNPEVMKELLYYGVDCTTVDNDGNTPAHVAAYHGNFDCLPLLINQKGMREIANDHGETVFHAVMKAKRDEIAILKVLDFIKGQFDPSKKNLFQETIHDLAVKRNLDRVYKALSNSRCVPNLCDVHEEGLSVCPVDKKEENCNVVSSREQLVLKFDKEICIKDHLLHHCNQNQLGKIHLDEDDSFCHERCEVAKQIMRLISILLDAVANEDKRFSFTVLATGSAFEGFRIKKPDEFDFMIEMKLLSKNEYEIIESGNPGFARVRIKEPYMEKWQDMMSSEGYLNSQKLKQTLYRMLAAKSSIVPITPDAVLLFNKTNYDNCQFCKPLFQQSKAGIKMTLLWRGNEYPSMPVDIDLTPAIHTESWPSAAIVPPIHVLDNCERLGYHVIPKSEANDPLLWRISFSVAELSILQNVSAIQGACYTILKLIKEQTVLFEGKQFSHFGYLHTYILKTKFFEELEKFKDTEQWGEDKLVDRVCSVLRAVAEHLNQTNSSCIESYFLPGYNVLGKEDVHIAKLASASIRKSLLEIASYLLGEAVESSQIKEGEIVMHLEPDSDVGKGGKGRTLLE